MTLHLIYLIQSSHPLHYEVAVHSKGETRFLRRQGFGQGFEFIPAGPLQANMPGQRRSRKPGNLVNHEFIPRITQKPISLVNIIAQINVAIHEWEIPWRGGPSRRLESYYN